jgi:hypothetical protein
MNTAGRRVSADAYNITLAIARGWLSDMTLPLISWAVREKGRSKKAIKTTSFHLIMQFNTARTNWKEDGWLQRI